MQLLLLDIFYGSPGISCTEILPYIEDEYIYNEPEYNHIRCCITIKVKRTASAIYSTDIYSAQVGFAYILQELKDSVSHLFDRYILILLLESRKNIGFYGMHPAPCSSSFPVAGSPGGSKHQLHGLPRAMYCLVTQQCTLCQLCRIRVCN